MNKENLIKVAEDLERNPGKFNMRAYCDCVIGRGLRVIENRTGAFDSNWVQGSTQRIFDIDPGTNTADFCFGAQWPNDPNLAAMRLRYVARHGEAPHRNQWPRFTYAQGPTAPVVTPPVSEEDEYEEAALDEYEEAIC